MKKIIMNIAVLTMMMSWAYSVAAQEISSKQERHILLKVVSAMEGYKRYCAIDQDFARYKDSFIDLFSSKGAPVFNDIVGLSSEDNITAEEYANLLRSNSTATRIEVKNIINEGIFQENGQWKVRCSFDKSVNLTNECGVEFSSEFLNSKDYHLQATLIYYEDYDRCAIEKIECTEKPKQQLPSDFFVIRQDSKYDLEVKANGDSLRFNAMGQAFVPMDATFSYKDPEVQIKLVEEKKECSIYHLAYKSRRMRLRAHFDIPLGNYYSISSANNWEIKNSGKEFGIDWGYIFPSKSKVKFSLNTGLFYATSKINLSQDKINYTYRASSDADVDGDTYIRHYENMSIKEGLSLAYLGLPLYGDVDFNISPFFTLFLQAGLKSYLNITKKFNDYDFKTDVYGIYEQYGNVRLDGSWGYNGFGKIERNTNDVDASDIPVKSFSMDLFGGLGFRVRPIRSTPLYLEIGMQYQTGIIGMWDAQSQDLKYNGNVENPLLNAISQYTLSSGEQTKMLYTTLSNVKRQHLKLNIGIIYKF